MKKINNKYEALSILNNYILIATSNIIKKQLYIKSDNSILVINKFTKYYITKNDFLNDFEYFDFYIYKLLDEIDINEEISNLINM